MTNEDFKSAENCKNDLVKGLLDAVAESFVRSKRKGESSLAAWLSPIAQYMLWIMRISEKFHQSITVC